MWLCRYYLVSHSREFGELQRVDSVAQSQKSCTALRFRGGGGLTHKSVPVVPAQTQKKEDLKRYNYIKICLYTNKF